MKKINLRKGFTLIELLVVIAIIGILASIVLASLNTARDKTADVAIKANMANARSQAALFYDDNDTYDNVCIAAGGINPMILAAVKTLDPVSGVVGIDTDDYVYDASGALYSSVCHDDVDNWAAITSLKNPINSVTGGWCVDSNGASKEADVLLSGEVVCP